MKARLQKDREALKNSKLSDDERKMLLNTTKMDEDEVKYWSTDRQISHGMYHTHLKLTHGLMQRVKTVMEAYSQALAHGKIDATLLKSINAASIPKAFAQIRSELKTLRAGSDRMLARRDRLL